MGRRRRGKRALEEGGEEDVLIKGHGVRSWTREGRRERKTVSEAEGQTEWGARLTICVCVCEMDRVYSRSCFSYSCNDMVRRLHDNAFGCKK